MAPSARFVGLVYERATSGAQKPPSGWVGTTGVSPFRDHAVGAVYRDLTGHGLGVDELRRLYAANANAFMAAVRPAAVDYVDALLARQVPAIERLLKVVERDGERLRRAALAALRYSMSQRIDSAAGTVANPDEAAALARRRPGGPSVVDAFERVRYTRAVRVGRDEDLRALMAHPHGVRILKAYARSTREGTAAARDRLRESLAAIAVVRERLHADPVAIWRLPAAVAGGVLRLGLAEHRGTVAFAIAWAALEGRTILDKALEVALNAVAVLDLAGPVGRLIGAALDIVLNAAATAVALLREVEQDQAGAASAFAPDAQKLSEGGNYLGVAFQGVVAIAAAVALPSAISAVSTPRRAAAKALREVTPPISAGRGPAGWAVPERLVEAESRHVAERSLGSAERSVPVPHDLDPDALALIRDADEVDFLQQSRPLAGNADPARDRMIRDRAKERVAAAADEYTRVVAYAAGRREKAIRFMELEYMIDTRAMTKSRRSLTAAEFPRNSRAFWRNMVRDYPYLFSETNWTLVMKESRAPRVDPTWLDFHPTQRAFQGDILVHHHIEQGPWAVGIPEAVHHNYYPELHPITNDILDD